MGDANEVGNDTDESKEASHPEQKTQLRKSSNLQKSFRQHQSEQAFKLVATVCNCAMHICG